VLVLVVVSRVKIIAQTEIFGWLIIIGIWYLDENVITLCCAVWRDCVVADGAG
jgi:hypothetical protein